jgi:hypothetical protein
MKAIFGAVGGGVLVLALAFGIMGMPQADVSAAPAAIPTPASVTRPAGDGFVTFNPFSGTPSITTDTTSTCFDVGGRSVIDVLYVIDQTDVNTVTLTSKWSIDGTTTVSGINLVAANAADASDMVQLQVFGRYFCILADVSNTNAVAITAHAIAK